MSVDLSRAASFLSGHGRLLDRRRFELLVGETGPDAVLAAVDGYRNPDGGYGWGLEPDLRAPESQPGGALHAFEVFEEIAPARTPRAVELCDWLDSVTLPDGGLPFALPVADATACAPFWAGAEHTVSSLQSTVFTAGVALRVAAHDPAVAAHPWLERATQYCFDALAALDSAPHAIALSFAVRFLDAAHERYSAAPPLLARLGRFVPDTGLVPVQGGSEGETMRALNFASVPGSPASALLRADVIEAELDALAAQQQEDGGWTVDFASYSPAATLEWRGYATVGALLTLKRAGRLFRP
ncbi:hypothetical protein SAMN05216266_104183 [Amycolatopsis marina]|uniref:Prenyltransferase and squalene oxidase repeat-containing protein n=1 Tax=Amycolatopsis marina TaxID=490629 RepID=A0A1I0Y296_9PSEU|nr:hypothetical protein [Amycolatopsis marina]SFB07302.1 hypothetical protein SAMN05216266_104183 [Amycolatopsis marina]